MSAAGGWAGSASASSCRAAIGPPGDRPRRRRHRQHERPAFEREHAHVRDGHDRRGARDVADERQLAERLTGTEPGDVDAGLIDRDRTALDDVEPVADAPSRMIVVPAGSVAGTSAAAAASSAGAGTGANNGSRRRSAISRNGIGTAASLRPIVRSVATAAPGSSTPATAIAPTTPRAATRTPAASAPAAAPAIDAASAIPNTTASRFVGTRRWSTVRTATSTTARPTPGSRRRAGGRRR